MAYYSNPFLERMSERTTSDLDFVRMFSPKILEKLDEEAFGGGVHVFRSAPGAGKTTLLRVFTPAALKGFWSSHKSQEVDETFQKLVDRGVLDSQGQPHFLGVLLTCASGYADLPHGPDIRHEGLFRALFDCRIVLRTLRGIAALYGLSTNEQLDRIHLEYTDDVSDLKGIPNLRSISELSNWAEKQEQRVYDQLDDMVFDDKSPSTPVHYQLEGPIWLQSVKFFLDGKEVASKRILMIDDLHKLRKKQRNLLIDELTVQRLRIPIWLAERTIALGDELLSQGARQGRDLHEYSLEEMWTGGGKSQQFQIFAQNILDRRMMIQSTVPVRSFSLRGEIVPDEIRLEIKKGIDIFNLQIQPHENNVRYSEWFSVAAQKTANENLETLKELYSTRILLARDQSKRQLSLELALSAEELVDRDNSQVRGAAEIFMHNELKIPYYFGLERLCIMASNNIEELLSLAANLYTGMQNKQVLRKADVLSPGEQEKLLKEAAKRKRDFIPKNHTEGLRAQKLLDSIGAFCVEKTFVPNAPYAPGVTGIRLSQAEMTKLTNEASALADKYKLLHKILCECVAENLLNVKSSQASTSRESGDVFYLNRTLCAHYGLPLQLGGWQDVLISDLIDWIDRGYTRRRRLEVN